jgi:hypothetical protein
MNQKTTEHAITGTINKPVLIPSLLKTNIPGTRRCFIGNQEQKFNFQSIGGPASIGAIPEILRRPIYEGYQNFVNKFQPV